MCPKKWAVILEVNLLAFRSATVGLFLLCFCYICWSRLTWQVLGKCFAFCSLPWSSGRAVGILGVQCCVCILIRGGGRKGEKEEDVHKIYSGASPGQKAYNLLPLKAYVHRCSWHTFWVFSAAKSFMKHQVDWLARRAQPGGHMLYRPLAYTGTPGFILCHMAQGLLEMVC